MEIDFTGITKEPKLLETYQILEKILELEYGLKVSKTHGTETR